MAIAPVTFKISSSDYVLRPASYLSFSLMETLFFFFNTLFEDSAIQKIT
jgi:hypothetical protein